jgi:hypothetical protein
MPDPKARQVQQRRLYVQKTKGPDIMGGEKMAGPNIEFMMFF